MEKASYETIRVGIQDTSDVQKGKDIYYQCNKCQSIIPSWPKDSTGCSCGNIEIDKLLIIDVEKRYTVKSA